MDKTNRKKLGFMRILNLPAYLEIALQLARGVNPWSYKSLMERWNWISLWRTVRPYSGMSVPRMQTLYNLTKALDKNAILGDIVECGVNKGGSAGMLATASENSLYDRTLWLFDSFMGLPKPTEIDGSQVDHRAGTIVGSEDKVLELMEKLAISPKRVRIVPG